MSLKISGVETHLVATRLDPPIVHPFLGARTRFVSLVVLVHTEDGPSGFGYVTGESPRQMAAVGRIVEDLAERLEGQCALRRTLLYDRMWNWTVDLLHEGAATLALAALDIALWDIAGKQAGEPLWRLLGGYRDAVPCYASWSLWRHFTLAEIETAGAELVERGFDAVKLRLGGRPPEEDVARAVALRRVVGPDVRIMTDVLWGLRSDEALKLARLMADSEADLFWFEEPVRDGHWEGLRRVREQGLVTVAAGERVSRLADVQELARSVDHAILDVHHIGGITPWLRAAAVLEIADLPISVHVAPEIQAHLVAAQRTGAWVEYMTWWDALFEEPLRPVAGKLTLSGKPGLGLEVSRFSLRRLAVDG
ncbi:L-alanine-DL-glutamate epimerase [Tistlia consotensis]|uniref:L-alanine-DL-glutamate epimerase n=1 Tax=Tistlia consotensis USBA 355 TaxID=560819 RepID=A0A1Y6B4V0_9PROT|nr:mandelate racemase/muconate lactonizing enzyme family protein [Tistlia consotensis]SME90361.1 L-alanine-DL-glutamate epimerase [Tistlia consotensis USBA 355]SNR26656.1 L-alanine-DL-glutamate epimerase [Tistlia consotensis]